MLRLYLENEIIELSNNLETIWVSVLDKEEQSECLDMVVIQKQNEIEELSINIEKKIMNYIFEDDGNVSEVIGALDIIHHLDKIAHTTQSIYKWIMYRKYGNIN